ncbi:M55 family metallopeptidase [Pseudochrobactrum sp. MP213Fo]|uniref:M55 family metallopeptidase n=1 Tax=Pseudochrobactrum sp. MP213Fo TaxID=3022250 RepID=UPI003B9F12E5
MRVYICADIEGVAGVVTPQQGQPGNAEYERARRLMTEEVNAAIEGALEGGATYILVNDSHGPMVNIIPELLHPAAELILGRPKKFNMAAGLDEGFDVLFFTGHHASAAQFGILAHTTNGFAFRTIKLNGQIVGEPGIYGAYAGELGIPVALISGDDQTELENKPFFPAAEFAVVKTALGNRAARQISVQNARLMIREKARQAVEKKDKLAVWKPFNGRINAEFIMNSPVLADQMAIIPCAKRTDATTIAFDCADVAEAVGWMGVLSGLSAGVK